MKNPCRIAMILVSFCVSFLTFSSNPASAQQVVKVGAGEYLTVYLMSDKTVRVSSQATITPVLKTYAGLSSVVDVQGGQYHVTALDQQGKVYKLSNNATFVATTNDEFGAAFTGNFLIRGFWQANVSLRGADSSLWYWGIADPMNYAGGATITAPKKLVMPAGKKFKKVETGSNWTLADAYILALASDGTVWKYSRGNANPVQITIAGETIADIAVLGSNAQVLLTKTNKLFGAGILSRYVGTASNSSTFQNVTSAWVTAGVKFPIKELVANSSTLHIIDADDNMFGSGTNVQGEVGTGVEYTMYRLAGIQGGVFGYGFANNILLTPPTQIQGKFKNINTSTTITFYLYAQDLGSNWYSWGRNKAFALGNGKSLGPYAGWGGTGDYAAYPNALDVPMPKRINPASVVWTLQNFSPTDNIPPVVGAGINQYLNSVSSTTLYGKAFQMEFSVTSQLWTKVSGPAGGNITTPTALNTTITGLTNGTYVYRLAATNTKNQTSTDEVSIIVGGAAAPANALPTVNAGSNQTIVLPVATATLTGSAADSDGTIASYAWTKVSGPAGGTIVNAATSSTAINTLQAGTYVYSLKVTDNVGGTATASVNITVSAAAANQLPTAFAGADTAITLPANTASLRGSGTDANGTISSYQWTKIAGPTTGTITNATSANATLTALAQGTYQYQLTVTDNEAGVAKDTVQIVVNAAVAAATLLPAVNPANIVNGVDYKYYEGTWSVLPQFNALTPVKTGNTPNFNIALANRSTLYGFSFTGYINVPADGQYKFYTSSDDGSSLYIDNVLTVANDGLHSTAEKSGTIGLKAGKHAITGLFFQGTGGGVFNVSYEGTGIAKQLIPAGSLFRVNQLPVANAGSASTITLPVNTVTLTGSGTDADGTVASYLWKKISGPTAGTIVSSTTASTAVSNLGQGTYSFELTVTDNSGQSAKSNVQVTVNAAPAPLVVGGKTLRVNLDNGQAPYNNAQWNNWKPVANVSSGIFKYEDGTSSNISVALPQGGNFSDNGVNYAATAAVCPPQVLRIASMHTITRLFNVSGLSPAKQYTFEFFGSRGYTSGSKTIFKTGNTSDTINTDYNTNDFAKFVNVKSDINGNISFTISSTSTYNYFSAFHIVEQAGAVAAATGPVIEESIEVGKQVFQGETLVETGVNTVSVYPNPFVGSFKVQLNHKAAGEYVLKLSTTSGQSAYLKKVSKPAGTIVESINVSNLTPGTYILEIISVANGNKSVHKIIKN